MVTRLVVNADDGGLALSTDDAILRCAEAGLVRAVTVVANGPTAETFVPRAVAAGLDVGLHLNFTAGVSLTGVPVLDKYEYWRRAVAGEIDPVALHAEMLAQWERLASFGVAMTHLDGHNHVHVWPGVLGEIGNNCYVRRPLGREPGPAALPACFVDWAGRLPGFHVDRFAGYAFADEPCATSLLRSVVDARDADGDAVELMVHPGVREGSPFVRSSARAREVECLCDPIVVSQLEDRGVEITSFSELGCTSP